MAHGAPDLSDLLAVIEEPTVVAPLHQISSGHLGGNLQMGAPGFFSPTNLPFSNDLNAHELSESEFLPTDSHGHSFKDTAFQVANDDVGSLGSFFLSSIGHQLDTGKAENEPFVSSMPLQDMPKNVLSKPRQQNNPSQQIRSSGQPSQRSTGTPKSSYAPFGSNIALSSTTDVGASGLTLKSSNIGPQSLPFISQTDVQPVIPNVQTGDVLAISSQKKASSGQFAFPHHGTRQQSLPTNPPRPQSATSNTSEHISRPGSVQQPSPSCGSSHSGDPATPLTPQSYKPATPGNPSVMQQQRRPGFVEMHHSPQISQVGSSQQSVIGYQSQTSTDQSIISSSEALDDLPTPIKNAFDSIDNVATFQSQNDDIDSNSFWNTGPALMAPSALFVSTAPSQLQSNSVLVTPDQNLGFGLTTDMYGVNLPTYTSRVPPRNEPAFEESLTPKQNEILNQLSANGLKKTSVPSAQLSGSVNNECTPIGIQVAPNVNVSTMQMMNQANTAGAATVEKLFGSNPYEAISPVSDYSMSSPASKAALPEELTDNLYLSSKFSSEMEMPTSQQDHSSMSQDLTDPVMLYTTQKDNTQSQHNIPDLLGAEGVSELITFSGNDWSNANSSMTSSHLQSSLTMTSQSSNITVSRHDLESANRWTSNNTPDYLSSVNIAHQTGQDDIRLSDYAPTAKIAASQPNVTQDMSSQKQIPSQSMSVSTNEVRSFGISRRKASSDKTKGTKKGNKLAGQSESAFGFESDDETETIRLIPQSAPNKRPGKQSQSSFHPVKPRTMNPVGPNDDLRQKMEAIKQLQQQQIRLQQIQAYQSQNANNPSITNPNYGRHFQFQNKAHILPPASHQSQHDATRNKNLVESTLSAGVNRLSEVTMSYSPLFGAYTAANMHTTAKTSNSNAPAPLSLAQPNLSHGDIPRYKPAQSVYQAEQHLSASKSSDVQGIPYFMESVQKSTAASVLPEGVGAILTSVTKHEMPQAAVASTTYSSTSASVFALPSQTAQFPPPWKPTTTPSTVGLVSTSAIQHSTKVSYSPAVHASSLLTAPSLPSDHSSLNLDWLHREPEHVTCEKTSNSTLDFLNSFTRPSPSEKNSTSKFDVLNNTQRPIASDKNLGPKLDVLNTISSLNASEKSSSSNHGILNIISRQSASVPTSSYAPHRPSASVHSSFASANTPLLSDDYLVPMKQSIHNVNHIPIPKMQPPPVSSTFTPTMITTKKHPTNETRQINFRKHRILEGALPSTIVKSTPSVSVSSALTTSSDTPVSVAFSVLDKQRRYVKEHSNSKLKQRTPQVQDNVPVSTNVAATPKEKLPQPKPPLSDSRKTDVSGNGGTKQSGGMFELFSSLLKEASESALKSRIESKETELEKSTVKETLPKVTKSQPAPAAVSRSDATKLKSGNSSVSAVTCAPPPTSKPTISVTTAPSVTAKSVASVLTSRSISEIKKPAKKNWSTSAIPFKRRYIDDTQLQLAAVTSKPSVTVTNVTTSSISNMKPVVSMPKISVASTPVVSTKELVKSSPVKSSTVKSSPLKPPPKASVSASTATPPVSSDAATTPTMNSEKTAAPGGVLKLRITAFRSSRGDIIHQSSMLSKDEDGAGSDQSSHKKLKKRKKRDKKRRHNVSSSDGNSTVVSQPKAEQREKLIEKAKLNEQITKELVELATSIKENHPTSSNLSPQRQKRTRPGATEVNAVPKKTPKRTRVAKSSSKKKQESKVAEPIARYLPKSVLQASSGLSVVSSTTTTTKTTVNIPATYQRAPGKLPLYLTSSDGKASTAPTIQLVARTSTKMVNTAQESKSVQPSKPMTVKISKTTSSKSLSTQLLTNSNVQYIIPTTRSQPRVILPNMSTSSAVSVVSPLIVRSFPTGSVALSASTPIVTAITKPQLFTFPLTLNDSASHTLKSISAKISEKAKGRAESAARDSSSGTLVQSSVVEKSTLSVTSLKNSTSTTGLIGTLNMPRVTTKVLPSSTDQDANVNNFQSVLLKLITSPNPVPNYIPPDPPHDICAKLDENNNFQCPACEDCFLFKDNLEHHYARRSILIKVRCMQCDRDMVFLNKCKLLMHARQHSDGMQFNNAHISPLPLSMCKPRSKEWFLNNRKADNESTVQRKLSLTSCDGCSSTTPETPAAFPTTLVCTECGFVAPTAEGLEEHFQRTSAKTSPEKPTEGNKTTANFMCDICSVTAPNQCSFMAHMRMHQRAKPHTCPECGRMFNDAGFQEHAYSESRREIDFNFHLSVECFHLCRMTAFKCRICNLICKNAELLRRHLEDRHLQMFHKCLDCPMAFKTQDNFTSHQRSAHAISPMNKMIYKCPKTIHKCPLCDTVFTDDNATQQLFLLQKHFEGHMSHPSINITAYKCLFCNDIFEKKSQVRDHIKTVHDVIANSADNVNNSKGAIDSGSKSNSSKRSRSDDTGPARKLPRIVLSGGSATSNAVIAAGTLGGRDGSKLKTIFPGDLVARKKNAMQPLKLRFKERGPRVQDEADVDDQMDSLGVEVELTAISSVESIMRDGKRVFPCGQCSKELLSASSRVNHIRLKHQGIRTLFCCPYCPSGKIKFAKKISMKKHLKKIHGMEEVTKRDVRIKYVKLPIGQRFDRATLNVEEGTVNPPPAQKSEAAPPGSTLRKKITRPCRRSDRQPRLVRQDVVNPHLYCENSDSEVERIMSNRAAEHASFGKSETSDEEMDFSKLKFPSVYYCAKCDHECEDRLAFQAHIMEHKEDVEAEGITGTMQCMECGLCFASETSHVKHLFIKHKIRKRKLLEKYDIQLKEKRKAEGSLPYRLSEEFLNNPNGSCDSNVKKYKCSVCFKRFEEDAHLKSHMRTHGLAFVRSRHAS